MLSDLFWNPGFMPHVHCYLNRTSLVWAMLVTDLSIGIIYFVIAGTLWWLVKQAKLQFSLVILFFGLFIAACGATHFMEVWTLWHPDYWAAAFVKGVTTVASMGTAIYLFLLRDPIISVSKASGLSEQRRVELEELTKTLEERVLERTQNLENSQRRLEISEDRYKTLIETLPQLIWICLPNGHCNYLSQQWLDYTGLNIEEQLEFGWLKVVHPDDRLRTEEHWKGAVEGLHPYNIEFRLKRKDGIYHWFKTRGISVRNKEGEIISWFGTCTDVQDQYEIRQKLEESLVIRDEFLSIASHELRTPLMGMKIQIQMFNRVLLKGESYDVGKVSGFITQMDRGLNRIVRLVDDMLDISRIQSGKLTLNFEQLDFAEIVRDILEQFKPELRSNGIDLEVHLVRNLIARVDRFRVEQVLTNLVTNVIRYAPNAPLRVDLNQSADWAVLHFKDNGPGIPEAAVERIFLRFERLVSADKVSGMGLGLYISKQIVEGHGGTIHVVSEKGNGACFIMRLPIQNPK